MLVNILFRAVCAGWCIGLGTICSLCAPDKYSGALFFSLGLLYIRMREFCLLTGRNQYLGRGVTFAEWSSILAGNAIGVISVALLAITTGSNCSIFLNLQDLNILAAEKFFGPTFEYFFPAVMCGALMTIATYPDASLIVSSVCVVTFILCGFRHCIADIFWLVLYPEINLHVLNAWIVTIVGNLVGGWLMGIGMKAVHVTQNTERLP